MEKRIDREIREQEGLLQDIEEITALKMMPLKYHKDRLVWADGYGLKYTGLGHVHDLLGLLYIGSSTFRGETIEIKPQDHIDVKHDSGRKIAGQRI